MTVVNSALVKVGGVHDVIHAVNVAVGFVVIYVYIQALNGVKYVGPHIASY